MWTEKVNSCLPIFSSKKMKNIYSKNNKIKIIKGGKPYFDCLLEFIQQAKETIHLQTYIFKDDATGTKVGDALIKAAERGVLTHLLVDGYASQGLSDSFISNLTNAGVKFRFFEPVFRSKYFYFGRRLHQKVFVSDSRYALVGGINVADHYNDTEGHPAWLDFALLMEGQIASQLCILCWKSWRSYSSIFKPAPCDQSLDFQNKSVDNKVNLRMRRNDWVRRRNEISATYVEMLRDTKSSITIMGSYFLPSSFIRKLLDQAAARGIKVQVVTAGVSDVKVFKHAERWLYNWLLRRNIKIYEYQPVVMHCKVAICDGKWFTLGSYNLNNISTYASIELNIDVDDATYARSMEEIVHQIIKEDCVEISELSLKKSTNVFIQFIRWCSYQFIIKSFYLSTFYFKRRD